MSLAEYRVHSGVDVSLVDPLASRLLSVLELFGGRVLIISGRRSLAEQQALWDAYLAGGNLAARPGTSNHERGMAADLRIVDASVGWVEVHNIARTYGLVFPIPSEDWHVEADPSFVEPEDDMAMSDADMRRLAGFIAEALDARTRTVHSYRDGGEYTTTARTLEEWEFAEQQQAALAAQNIAPK